MAEMPPANLVPRASVVNALSAARLPPEEWERRFKDHIIGKLLARTGNDSGWSQEAAEYAALAEFEAQDLEDLQPGYEADPEGAADERLSYWRDGV